MAKLWSCMIRYCVVRLGGTILPYEHSLSTFRVEGWAVIGTKCWDRIIATETARKLVHSPVMFHPRSVINDKGKSEVYIVEHNSVY
jgi:hypothetical protein